MSARPARTGRPARAPRGLTQKLGAVVLGFAAIVVFLGGLTVFGLGALPEAIPQWWGIVGGAVVAVLMVIAAGMMGSRAGLVIGWALQVVVLLSAILVPAMLLVAVVFGGMWVYAMVVGTRVDRRAAATASDTPPGHLGDDDRP